MDGRLTDFLQYDYAEARTIATTLLTASGGLLAGSLVFTEKIIGLRASDVRLWKKARLGLYAFASAGFCSGGALIGNYANMLKVLRRYRGSIPDGRAFVADIAAQNQSMAILFVSVGVLVAIGLFYLLDAADVRHRVNEDFVTETVTPAVEAGGSKPAQSADITQSHTS